MRRGVVALATGWLALLLGTSAPRAAAGDFEEAKKALGEAQHSKDWKKRVAAYSRISDFDQPESVEIVLGAIAKETDYAVLSGLIRTLGGYRTKESRDVLIGVLQKGKGIRRTCVMLAMRDQPGETGKAELLEALNGSDPAMAVYAALALGKKGLFETVEALTKALSHKDWQVRSAAARAIGMFGVKPPKDTLVALATLVATSDGRDRGDAITALEAVTKTKLGFDPEAWKAVAAGEDPAKVTRNEKFPPSIFGVPIYGKRVVILLDRSLTTDEPHPFSERTRLQQVCKVPGGRDVPWFSTNTVLHLYLAFAKRLVADLPAGAQFDVVSMSIKVKSEMGKLVPASTASKAAAEKAIEAMKPESGADVQGALLLALDAGGKDPAAWASGPDEIVYLASSNPFRAENLDSEQIGAAMGLKARMRGVVVHGIGVGGHPFNILQKLADATGGRYLDLSK